MKKIMTFLSVLIICGAVTLGVLALKPVHRTAAKNIKAETTGMPVSVRSIKLEAYKAVVRSFGEVVPLWRTTMKAQVDGAITFLSRKLRVGEIVKRGELLVRLEKSALAMQIAEARNRMNAARVALLKEEQEAGQARRNWSQSMIQGRPESPLVLRIPQLTAAQSELAAAQAELTRAETLFSYTDVRAPFDGVIMRCMVGRGETLFIGEAIAEIYGLEAVEVGVQLDAAQWALLPDQIDQAVVRLNDPHGNLSWEAAAVRKSLHIDRDSRLRTLFLQVRRPLEQTPPLLPGAFVQAEVTGREIPGLICIPEPALTKEGIVWFVDPNNRLQPRRMEPLFYGEGTVFIHAPVDIEEPVRAAVSPNSSFIRGLLVQPIADSEGDQ